MNAAAVGPKMAGLGTRFAAAYLKARATGESRKAVLCEQTVIDGDALRNSFKAPEVVMTVETRRIAIDSNFPAINLDSDGRTMATLMLDGPIGRAEDFACQGVDSLESSVRDHREVKIEFLRNLEPIDEHKNPCQYRNSGNSIPVC